MDNIYKAFTIDPKFDSFLENVDDLYQTEENDKQTLIGFHYLYKRDGNVSNKFDTNDLNDPLFKLIFKDEMLTKLVELEQHIIQEYNPSAIWLIRYPPNTGLQGFHVDFDYNRHVMSLNDNPRFFSYETTRFHDKLEEYNELYRELNDIDKFNEHYINDLPENRLFVLDKGGIYNFGKTGHFFYNGSDKTRLAFVFDID